MTEAITAPPTIRLLSWNMGAGGPGPKASWAHVQGQLGFDVALLQEAPNPWGIATVPDTVPAPGARWGIGMNRAQTAVVRLSDRVTITPVPMHQLGFDGPLELGVSRPGTLTVAKLAVPDTGEELLLASVYAQWEGPASGGPGIYADASMHRILSDLSPLLSWPDLPVIVAGDFNTVLGAASGFYGGNWPARDRSVFSRFEALGLRLAGPQYPNGVQADPPPAELPPDSLNVPTFGTSQASRMRQLDYCYVTADLVDRVKVAAMNSADEWGPSDHCILAIELEPARVRTWTEESFLAEIGIVHGPLARDAAADLFEWARAQGLRIEFGTGPEGQWYAQLDQVLGGPQFTFSVRTRGDVVIQFQWMKAPFAASTEREELRLHINEAVGVPFAEIGADRLIGRPTIPLDLLLDPSRRAAFLSVFTQMVARTREIAAL